MAPYRARRHHAGRPSSGVSRTRRAGATSPPGAGEAVAAGRADGRRARLPVAPVRPARVRLGVARPHRVPRPLQRSGLPVPRGARRHRHVPPAGGAHRAGGDDDGGHRQRAGRTARRPAHRSTPCCSPATSPTTRSATSSPGTRASSSGGTISPRSGDDARSSWVGATDAATWDERYWHPDGPPAGVEPDRPTPPVRLSDDSRASSEAARRDVTLAGPRAAVDQRARQPRRAAAGHRGPRRRAPRAGRRRCPDHRAARGSRTRSITAEAIARDRPGALRPRRDVAPRARSRADRGARLPAARRVRRPTTREGGPDLLRDATWAGCGSSPSTP